MKKFLTLAAILAALTLTVTACSSKDNADNSSDTGTSTTEPGIVGDDANNSEVVVTPEANAPTAEADAPDAGASDVQQTGLDAYAMAGNAFASLEWPAMMELPDAETAMMMTSIDPALCEDYYMSTQLMSAHLNEVLICKPSAGNEEALQAQFDAHFEYIQNGAAFYPEQEVSAAGAVMGKTDDGYLYIIVHENGATAEAALQNNPPAEMPEAFARVEMPMTAEADDGIA